MLTDEVIALSRRLGRAGWNRGRHVAVVHQRDPCYAGPGRAAVPVRLSAPGVQSNPYALEEPNEVGRAFFKTDSEERVHDGR